METKPCLMALTDDQQKELSDEVFRTLSALEIRLHDEYGLCSGCTRLAILLDMLASEACKGNGPEDIVGFMAYALSVIYPDVSVSMGQVTEQEFDEIMRRRRS